MNQEEQLQRYRELMGGEATKRQTELNEKLYPCCGSRRTAGHHPLCREKGRK